MADAMPLKAIISLGLALLVSLPLTGGLVFGYGLSFIWAIGALLHLIAGGMP